MAEAEAAAGHRNLLRRGEKNSSKTTSSVAAVVAVVAVVAAVAVVAVVAVVVKAHFSADILFPKLGIV